MKVNLTDTDMGCISYKLIIELIYLFYSCRTVIKRLINQNKSYNNLQKLIKILMYFNALLGLFCIDSKNN